MGSLTFVTTGRVLIYLLIFTFLNSCANKDVAKEEYMRGNYKDAYRIWKQWADRGYGNVSLKLAKMAQEGLVNRSDEEAIKYAKKAYLAGEDRAAFILEDIYTKNAKYKKAIYWMKKGDFHDSNDKTLDNHLFLIKNYMTNQNEQELYLNMIAKLAQAGDVSAAYKLGKFYQDKNSIFYNINRSISFYKMAYDAGDIKSGVELALIYLKSRDSERQGVSILRKTAIQGSTKASITLGEYMYGKLYASLESHIKPCIALSFKKPIDFYIKKLTLNRLHRLYMEKNVAPWFHNAYKLGDKNGMIKLIRLDIKEDNFAKSIYNYSNMNLKNAISFLENIDSKSIGAKLLLAQIYIKYPSLKRVDSAKEIYLQYKDINETDADWRLYQLYKTIDPNSKERSFYLNSLVTKNFTPAVIEYNCISILNRKKIKKSYANLLKAYNKGDIKAMECLLEISTKENLASNTQNRFKIAKKICESKPFDSKIDLSIANLYIDTASDKNLTKAATIYQFYAEQNNSTAQYELANIYKKLGEESGNLKWIEKSKELGNSKANLAYNIMVLKGEIKGDVDAALNRVYKIALSGDTKANMLLGDLYAKGNVLPFNPKKAISYYKKIEKTDRKLVSLKIVNLYRCLNISGIYNDKIIDIYSKLISMGYDDVKIDLAQFLISIKKYDRAKKLLNSLFSKGSDRARYLLYKLSRDKKYINDQPIPNRGTLLLAYAKNLAENSRKKALLYAFRANLCSTSGSGGIINNLIRLIDNPIEIYAIYKNAKRYPKCSNFKSER